MSARPQHSEANEGLRAPALLNLVEGECDRGDEDKMIEIVLRPK